MNQIWYKKDAGRGPFQRILLGGAAFVVLVAGMRAASELLVPFMLSIFISIISAPPLFWLKRHRVPTSLAVLIVIVAIVTLVFGLGVLVGSSVDDFVQNMPHYQKRLSVIFGGLVTWLADMGVDVGGRRLIQALDPGAAMKLTSGLLTGLSAALTNGVLIALTVVFILLEASSFPIKLYNALKDPESSMPYFEKFTRHMQRYMAIKTLLSLITGATLAIWLAILGVDYPLLWGLLAFLLNYVPNIGSIIAAVPAVLLALIQLGTGSAVLTGAGYLVVNMVIGNMVEPKVMGQGLGLSTLVVFLSLVFWGWVFGPVGMLLSVPLTMTIKIALDSSDETRWFSLLIGSEADNRSERT